MDATVGGLQPEVVPVQATGWILTLDRSFSIQSLYRGILS